MSNAYRLGDWTVRPRHNCIERGDEVVHLKPKSMAVLECLLRARGEVVTRDEMFEHVWPGGVISDATLTQCIVELRRAFADSAQTPRVIKTIPKVGFCLIPAILELAEEPGMSIDRAYPNKQGVLKRTWAFGAALVIAVSVFGSWWYQTQVVSAPEAVVHVSDMTPSIAVLPFVNMSDEPGNEYFADGLTEELQILLAKIPQLKVSARTSSFAFRNREVTIAEIARTLNVAHLLEGSVRKSDRRIRISVKLIEVQSGFELWSESYDRTLDDIFAVQNDVATAVVDALRISLITGPPQLQETDAEVYSLYLQGKYFWNLRDKENLGKAVSAFNQALAIDPDYAPAWIGIAWSYETQSRYGYRPWAQGVALAREAAERALAINDSTAVAWSSLAYLKKTYDWDWQGAEADMETALQLEPNNADVLGGAASLASSLGQLDKAIELFERSVALDPLGLSNLMALGNRYRAAGRYDEALEKYNQVLTLYPEHPFAHQGIANTYLDQGNPELALTEIHKRSSDGPSLSLRAKVLFTLGKEVESLAMTNEYLEIKAQDNPMGMAMIYAWRGEKDSAFKWLEKAFDQRARSLSNILWNPVIALLESDPRYPIFLDKLGLREYWESIPTGDEGSP